MSDYQPFQNQEQQTNSTEQLDFKESIPQLDSISQNVVHIKKQYRNEPSQKTSSQQKTTIVQGSIENYIKIYTKAVQQLIRKLYPKDKKQINILPPIVHSLDVFGTINWQYSINFFSLPTYQEFQSIIKTLVRSIKFSFEVGYIQINLSYYFIIPMEHQRYIICNLITRQYIQAPQLYQLYDSAKLFYQQRHHIPFLLFQGIVGQYFWRKAAFLQIGQASSQKFEAKKSFVYLLPGGIQKKIIEIKEVFLLEKPLYYKDFIFFDQYSTSLSKYHSLLKDCNGANIYELKQSFNSDQIFKKFNKESISKQKEETFKKYENEYDKLKKKEKEKVDGKISVLNQKRSGIQQFSQIIQDNQLNNETTLTVMTHLGNIIQLTSTGTIQSNQDQRSFFQYEKTPIDSLLRIYQRSNLLSMNRNRIIIKGNMKMIHFSKVKDKPAQRGFFSSLYDIFSYKKYAELQSLENLITNNQLSGITLRKTIQKILEQGALSDRRKIQWLVVILKLQILNGRTELLNLLVKRLKEIRKQEYLISMDFHILYLLANQIYFARSPEEIERTNQKIIRAKFRKRLSTVQTILQKLYSNQKNHKYMIDLPLILSNNQHTIGVIDYRDNFIKYITHKSKVIETSHIQELLNQFVSQDQVNVLLIDTYATKTSKENLQNFMRIIQQTNQIMRQNHNYDHKTYQAFDDTIEYYSKAEDKEIYCEIRSNKYFFNNYCEPKTHYGSLTIQQRKKIFSFKFNGKNSICRFSYYYWDGAQLRQQPTEIRLFQQYKKIETYVTQEQLEGRIKKKAQKIEFVWQMILQRIWIIQICIDLLEDYGEKRGYCPVKLGRYLHHSEYSSIILSINNANSRANQFLFQMFQGRQTTLKPFLEERQLIVYYLQDGKDCPHITYLKDHELYKLPQNDKPTSLKLPKEWIKFIIVMLGERAFGQLNVIETLIKQIFGKYTKSVYLENYLNSYEYSIQDHY